MLLGPLDKLLDGSHIDSITVIADGALHGFPFAILNAPGGQRQLVQDYSISYSPSIRSQNILQARKNQTLATKVLV